ncbi:MAG: hypothetical protein L6R28_23515 [Planctomycetes bacterium]|nr:hypothetical protein [Planctomycetota bacterium]
MKKSQPITVQAIWVPLTISIVTSVVILFVPEPLWFGLLWEGWDALVEFVIFSTLSTFPLLYALRIVHLRVAYKLPALRFTMRSLVLALFVAASLIGVCFVPRSLPGGVFYGWPYPVVNSNGSLDLSGQAALTILMGTGDLFILAGMPLLILVFGGPKLQFAELSNDPVDPKKPEAI